MIVDAKAHYMLTLKQHFEAVAAGVVDTLAAVHVSAAIETSVIPLYAT